MLGIQGCDLSIVIVSYNTLGMTRECLASIERNRGDLVAQIIVVDNNSQDGSVAMIKAEFPHVELIENKENKGFAAANNQAFFRCRGQFVLLLNSDTIILDEVLQASVEYLECHPRVGAMGCQVLNTDRSVQFTCSGFPTLARLLAMTLALDRIGKFTWLDRYLMRWWRRDDEREVEVISGCYLMIRKEVLENVGLLDESFFFFGEETDWCRRMREAGWQLVFAPVGRIIHHGGGSVKKLNFKRDVMLTAATVRLHRKYGSLAAEVTAYAILMGFNLSRAALWSIVACGSYRGKERSDHFLKVVASWRDCWPTGRIS
ncbi:glycosyltransferase family 2 protein [Desulfobulbus elongatus]|uniref:glycosyltransferase family 2 protein n=1 Tax=Desulfobulbus elongatus TaxID=53332 RepID=UPI00316AE451